MLGDFDPPTAINEHSYDNAQQSLSSLTGFSGWSLGLNEAEAGCGDNNSCSNDYDTMVIIGDPIDDGWGDWGSDPYPGDGDGNGNDGGGGGSGGSGDNDEQEEQYIPPPEPFYDLYTCQRSATLQNDRCKNTVGTVLNGELFICGIWSAFNPIGGVACAAFALTTIQVSYSSCTEQYINADDYCLNTYGSSGGSGAPGGGKTAP